ncbi:MAG TPA: endonuclease/exonuclease/phosphatase family protein [Prolixibacteraceae bacterium]|nr:endonuclease/exonuclease/phosphatase family protein [Prolixibacteraceae bacterium]
MKPFLFILLLFAGNLSMAQNIRVITYNIRFNNPDDGENAWPNRSNQVSALLDFHQADIFGLQEALIGQIEDIQAQLPNMEWVGVGRDDGKKAGEYSPLFYNSKKFDALQKGWFWLSETPEKPGLGWDAACNRVCTWLILKENKSKKKIMVLNTHFDHMGNQARTESAKLILRKIKELNTSDLPVILTGDFNLTPEKEPIAVIKNKLNDSRSVSKEAPYGPEGTFNGFKFDSPLKDRIDYIFVSNQIEVKQYGVLTDSNDQRYPSDHLPVFVNLELKGGKTK